VVVYQARRAGQPDFHQYFERETEAGCKPVGFSPKPWYEWGSLAKGLTAVIGDQQVISVK
jgi:hypothetical protein